MRLFWPDETMPRNSNSSPAAFFLMNRRLQASTLFPYTTLFRSTLQPRRGGSYRVRVAVHGLALGADGMPLVSATLQVGTQDRKSTRLNSSHQITSNAVFCSKKKTSTDDTSEASRRPLEVEATKT